MEHLYSEKLDREEGQTSQQIKDSIRSMSTLLKKQKLDVLKWDEARVAVPVIVEVILPPRGNYENIDIRRREPVLIVFHKQDYPRKAPRVYSNRMDFPKDRLAHLYVSGDDKPAPFCLIRGDLNDWYAEKQITDLILQTRRWLSDAASGSLVEDGDRFDPTRLEGYRGSCIYKYSELADVVSGRRSYFPDQNFAIGLFTEMEKQTDSSYPSFDLSKILRVEDDLKEAFVSVLKAIADDKKGLYSAKKTLGLIVWSAENHLDTEYFVRLPRDMTSLRSFSEQTRISLSAPLRYFFSAPRFDVLPEFPLILGVRRPKKLIGYDSDIEFFNFYLTTGIDDVKDGDILTNVPVGFQIHHEPLTLKKAGEVSGYSNSIGQVMIIGCGALGSKIVMHLARSGHNKMTLIDSDKFAPHNLVRNALLADQVGKNKANALSDEITKMYKHDDLSDLTGIANDVGVILKKEMLPILQEHRWLFDFTASSALENFIACADLPESTNICKGTLLDVGNIGLLMIEGSRRNPRIDDLHVMAYDLYRQKEFVSRYLRSENERRRSEITIISVGVGCNSETTILADEVVSLHAAAFTNVIKAEANRKTIQDNGLIFLNSIDMTKGFHSESCYVIVEPLIILEARNDPKWQIRVKSDVIDTLKAEMGKASPCETGGVFIGLINKKTRCIHVTDLILAPPDSEANEVCFFRGTEGLPEEVEKVKTLSGQTFGYVGEWHSHPSGPNGMSSIDLKSVRRFQKEYRSTDNPIPVFLMIVTPYCLLPFVFE